MKKLILTALMVLMAVSLFAQGTPRKHLILTTATRATAFGEYIKAGDFIYVTADGTLYQSKIAASRTTTMAYLLADTARYKVANTAWVSGAVAATTITASSTLAVTGASTFAAVAGTTGTFSGALAGTTLNTGRGANELYDMDQNVMTTSSPQFVLVSLTDTTGIRLQSANGTWYRLWISDTGTVGTATCTTP